MYNYIFLLVTIVIEDGLRVYSAGIQQILKQSHMCVK